MSAEDKKVIVKDVWLLRFIRSTDCQYEESKPTVVDENLRQFYVFDYYDRMVCKHGKLNYDECLGLSGSLRDCYQSDSVTSSYQTLTSLASEKTSNEDPFFGIEGDQEVLPFISLVNVTLIPEDQVSQIEVSEESVAEYLEKCTSFLKVNVQNACTSYFDKKTNCVADEHVKIQVLQSLNSGCFYVVLRTDHIELGYYVAMCIRTFEMEETSGFSRCQFSTYTTTCMSYKKDDQNIAVIPKVDCISSPEAGIVLRLSVDQRLIKDIAPLALGVGSGRGLYGRYDITVELNLSQFMRVYPWICACKFGISYPNEDVALAWGDDTLAALAKVLSNRSEVHCINERVLVGRTVLGYVPSRTADKMSRDENSSLSNNHHIHTDRVLSERDTITEKINNLIKRGYEIPYYEREFIHYISLIDDIWNDFESLRLQDDSIINGNMFYVQLWVLLDIVETYLSIMEAEEKKSVSDIPESEEYEWNERKRIAYQDLVLNLRRAITSINHFQKLIQSVNQQSFQAPNYDIQMHTDLEKLVIAHTEFARSFLTQRFKSTGGLSTSGEGKQAILPIYTVESYRESISAMPLFLLPYKNAVYNEHLICDSNPEKERLLLSIMMPTIDTLGNIYRTIPLICHEMAHNFRIISRKERNDALCEYIMNKVSHYVVQLWISKNCEKSIYVSFGEIEKKIKDIFAKSLVDGYIEFVGGTHDTSNIGALISNILNYLSNHIFISQDDYNVSSPIVTSDVLTKCVNGIAYIYQRIAVMEDACWYKDYVSCLEILNEKNRTILTRSEKEKIGSLARTMTEYTFAKYTNWYVSKLEELWHYIDDNYEISRVKEEKEGISEADAFSAFTGWINEFKEAVGVSVPCVPSEFDALMIKHVNALMKNAWFDKLKFRKTKKEDTEKTYDSSILEVHNGFSQRKKELWHVTQELWQNLKNLALLNQGANAGVKNYPIQKKLLNSFRSNLRCWIKDMKDDDPSQWMIFGTEMIQEYLNPLGIDTDSDGIFNETISSIINGMSNGSIENLVLDSTTVYREIFADLGMCAPLGLTVFGYLMVLSNAKTFRGNGLNDDMHYDAFGIERALTVCKTLSENKSEFFDDQCREYSSHVLNEINLFLTDEGMRSKEYKDFVNQVTLLLFSEERIIAENDIPDMRKIASYVREDKRSEYTRLIELMKSMWFFSMYVHCYRTKKEEHVNSKLLEHFKSLYELMSTDYFNVKQDSHVLLKIGQAYNKGMVNNSTYTDEEFKDSLSFVLYYYYKSWMAFNQKRDKTKMREWTDYLMGGL